MIVYNGIDRREISGARVITHKGTNMQCRIFLYFLQEGRYGCLRIFGW